MRENPWNIRFGQIFRHRLDELEKSNPGRFVTRLQDCFFFHPDEEEIVQSPERADDPFKPFDLNHNVELYRKHFTPTKSPKPKTIDVKLAEATDTTFIIIPGFAAELLKASQALEFSRKSMLERGFDFRYAPYPDSWGASRNCARELAHIFSTWEDMKEQIVFIGHSYGILVALDLLEEKTFKPWRKKVRALISLAGAISGGPGAEDIRVRSAVEILQIYRKIVEKKQHTLEARLVKALRDLLDLDIPWASGVREVIEKIGSFSDDLMEIPEGLESIGNAHSKWSKPENFPEDCELFSISALCPRDSLRGSELLPGNPDDLFLYLASKDLAKNQSPYNDTQLLLSETKFPRMDTLKSHHLATVRADHWGVAVPRVLSKTFEDPFPRQALLESIVLFLDEFYS